MALAGGMTAQAAGLAAAASPSRVSDSPHPVVRLIVEKANRVLIVRGPGVEIARIPILSLGPNPVGHKWMQGDKRTPEGDYVIEGKHRSAAFQWFLKISYPNEKDRRQANLLNVDPGGAIGIHGFPDDLELALKYHGQWTSGCIAVSNEAAEDLYRAIPVGTPITILP